MLALPPPPGGKCAEVSLHRSALPAQALFQLSPGLLIGTCSLPKLCPYGLKACPGMGLGICLSAWGCKPAMRHAEPASRLSTGLKRRFRRVLLLGSPPWPRPFGAGSGAAGPALCSLTQADPSSAHLQSPAHGVTSLEVAAHGAFHWHTLQCPELLPTMTASLNMWQDFILMSFQLHRNASLLCYVRC